MANDAIQQRGKALEDSFFREKDQQLLDDLRSEFKTHQDRVALAKACGVEDETILDQVMGHGVDCETLAALSLVPLVAVAWADGKMQDQERLAILEAATEGGIASETASHKLIGSWLDEMPSNDLYDAWKAFASALFDSLEREAALALREKVMSRANQVATAAGGILGLGKISAAESKVLEDLEDAFS